ncbi:MAG TPA: hypothetical protein VH108_09670 [Gaiellaceae bacterium]|jgi:hypothetical protein|nr:hypothetical protein [Gaiellaceae bacterium]
MAVDRRLLAHWEKQQLVRARARNNLPATWRNDPRPRMHAVTEQYVELLAAFQHELRALPQDDR